MQRSRPFLKWAGGKFRLLDRLEPHLRGKKLIEPFVGSGAVFLNIPADRYLLGDVNPDLINLYECLKSEKQDFIQAAKQLFVAKNNNQSRYLAFRKQFNSGIEGVERAALFVYLNRHGFNGLCRYNLSGGFNVPFGRYKKPYFPEKEMLHFLKQSRKAKFVCVDFLSVMNRARNGIVVFSL